MSIYAKEFLAIYHAFNEYSHILWEATKPTIVLTDNKAVTKFFQTKMIPPTLWNACDYVLQYNFKIAHVPGTMNTAADFLSRLDNNPHEKIELQIREDIQTTPIQVDIQNAKITEEDQLYFTGDDPEETEDKMWERKKHRRELLKQHQAESQTTTYQQKRHQIPRQSDSKCPQSVGPQMSVQPRGRPCFAGQ